MTPDEYKQANPLGGPATMFDTIAERIRAGEDMASVMDDYGIRFESSARPAGSNAEDRLRALMEGLEIRDIDNAIKASPEHCRRLGVEIATAAKLGANLYQAKKMAGI